eukprot:970210-Prymnesium_polylepis.2
MWKEPSTKTGSYYIARHVVSLEHCQWSVCGIAFRASVGVPGPQTDGPRRATTLYGPKRAPARSPHASTRAGGLAGAPRPESHEAARKRF